MLIAYECIHYLRNKRGKAGACAIKLDMVKAYDRVEWSYLHDIMMALGFPQGWCNLVMQCVTSVTFSVRVNGVFSPSFRPTRGIRQGDPISPYLFLLCSEGLTCLLKARAPHYISRGVRVSLHSPWISHLLFADDCMIFTQATRRGAERIAEILDLYNRGSGQLVNKQKSAVFFSENCVDEQRSEVHEALQIPTEALGEKYLGLPTASGRSGNDAFDYVSDRIRNFVNGWGENFLSCAGREVLITSNAQSVPTYPMSCFKLPAKVCQKMRTYISNYWWGSSVDNHRIHWQNWSKLTRSKADGGMGFRDMTLFNKAMLGKQGWRLMTRPDSLCARVIKGKYYPNGEFMTATRKRKSSETWRAIFYGREALKLGLIKRIGPGNSVNIWTDKWITGLDTFKPTVRLESTQFEQVQELFAPGMREWDEQLVWSSFIYRDALEILKLRPGVRLQEDVDAWAF